MAYQNILAALVGIVVGVACILPLAWKWQLGVQRVAIFVTTIGLIVSVVVLAITTSPVLTVVSIIGCTTLLSSFFLLYRFYRDPERQPPSLPGVVVSPADGIVIYIKRSEQNTLPVATKHGKSFSVTELLKTRFYSSDAWVIGISMNLLDVHVNRAPIAGVVTFQKHFPGKFGSLRLEEHVVDNERATTVIRAGNLQIAIVQIASRLVRQSVSYVSVGEQIGLGQRLGAIRLGSQVDVVLPVIDEVRLAVDVGDRLRAGETVIATINRALTSTS